MKTTLIAGTTLLLAGVAAFALNRDDREEKTVETPQEQAAAPETKTVELADPGQIEEPEEEATVSPLPEGWEVDETGHVWEPLSFNKPQVRNNGDGTITMRKLIRIYENGKMREIPITATATPVQKRLPMKQRVAPKSVTNTGSAEIKTIDPKDGE